MRGQKIYRKMNLVFLWEKPAMPLNRDRILRYGIMPGKIIIRMQTGQSLRLKRKKKQKIICKAWNRSLSLLDTMSRGRKIQRSIRKQMLLDRMSKSPRVQKPEISRGVTLYSRTALLQRKQKKNIPAMITAAGTPIISRRRKAGIKGGNIKAGKRQKPLILSRISRQRTPHLPKRQNRNFKAVKS